MSSEATVKSTGNPIHCTCGGKGTYAVENEDGFMGSLSTHLCACRINEPLREGQVNWWTLEGVGESEFESMTKQHKIEASIRRERPVSKDNHKLYRTVENMYWPTMTTLSGDLSGGDWTSGMLRDFAAWLTKVADDIDRLDEPESCGVQAGEA
jgi:hypothetical protein